MRVKLKMVSGTCKRGAYFSDDVYTVWEGEPSSLLLDVIVDAMDGLDEEYPEVFPPKEIWRALLDGDSAVAAQEPTDLLGKYGVCEFHWQE